tara:strand:- start:95 stop:283 length:189 start_codon:yes stop_codon:yes gene_type:complete
VEQNIKIKNAIRLLSLKEKFIKILALKIIIVPRIINTKIFKFRINEPRIIDRGKNAKIMLNE